MQANRKQTECSPRRKHSPSSTRSAQTGKPVVVLSGGEPLLREDIFAIARYGTEQGLRMVMGTSGYLLDQAAAKKLHESGIRAVAISLDSA